MRTRFQIYTRKAVPSEESTAWATSLGKIGKRILGFAVSIHLEVEMIRL